MTYVDTNKEVFNSEQYAIGKALRNALIGGQTGRGRVSQEVSTRKIKINIWADSKAAITQLQYTAPVPGQWLARCLIMQAE